MPKKPRRKSRIEEIRKLHAEGRKDEFRNCDAPGCPNIVSVTHLPKSFSGPVFCIIHRKEHG